MPVTAQQLVAAARAGIREIAAGDAATAIAAAAAPMLIDVREPGEFAAGHLPGAINIPRGVLEFQIEAHPAMGCATQPALADRERPLLVYCRTGGRAALAVQSLLAMGFVDVHSIAGGIEAWTAAGLPVEA